MALEVGLISLGYNVIKDLCRWVFKISKKQTPEEIVAHRQKWKNNFESHLHWIDENEEYGEAIIRDLKRMDAYPEVDEKGKGISSWFRVGVLGLYHRGVQVGLRYEGIKFDEKHKSWRLCKPKDEKPDLVALIIGRIPFDNIVEVDWDGDEYYYVPHIYCRFSQKTKEPYEETVFAKKNKSSGRPFYEDICDYGNVIKLSKKLKTGYYA